MLSLSLLLLLLTGEHAGSLFVATMVDDYVGSEIGNSAA